MPDKIPAAYQRIANMLADGQCVTLDGGVSTELERVGMRDHHISDNGMWGTWALYHMPQTVLEVHRCYVDVPCDVISTNTWAILSAPDVEARTVIGRDGPTHWMDAARLAIQLTRQAIEEAGKIDKCAVAFSINGDIESEQHHATLELLTRVFDEDPPDLILMETLSLIRENLTLPAVELMLKTRFPVWVSFRRCRHGVCGVHGQHWGGPEGDQFGRAARRLEQAGVGALLINCLPISHVLGMLPWLRDFTDMPLGVYPNLGRYLDPGWQFDSSIGPEQYAELARQWRHEGAQIIGGCCGVTWEHIQAAREALLDVKPGQPHPIESPQDHLGAAKPKPARHLPFAVWTDEAGRQLHPLPFPDLQIDPDVFEPTEGSFLIWKHLFRTGTGQGKRCLDVGCGSGILAIQLALNGAAHVHAIDINRKAVANTMANAFRNGVADRVDGTVEDVYTFRPDKQFDLIVASLYQMPVDPYRQITGHRPADYWGRNLVDHLLTVLPDMLSAQGVAYVMQLSILSQHRTTELLEEVGLEAKVIDFNTFNFRPVFLDNLEQIRRVEQLSDAYHLSLGQTEVMAAYLLAISHRMTTKSKRPTNPTN